MTKLTADTITDEQIRQAVVDDVISFDQGYRAAWRDRLAGESNAAYQRARTAAHALCAEILNARAEVKS